MPLRYFSSVCVALGFGGTVPVRADSLPETPRPAIHVFVDGVSCRPVDGEVRVPVVAKNIVFRIGDSVLDSQDREAKRFRYKFEGVDGDWLKRTGDMGLMVLLYDGRENLTGKYSFHVTNDSPSWNGSLEAAQLDHRKEEIVAPPGSEKIALVISSAGPPDTMGTYILDGLTIRRKRPDGSSAVFSTSRMGRDGEMAGWKHEGTHPEMAQSIRLKGADHDALGIWDVDPLAHAEWHLADSFFPATHAGDDLILEWDEMYSIGLADGETASYGVPAEGRYQFVVNTLDVMGKPDGMRSLAIVVYTPYWMSFWFVACLSGVLAIPVFWVGRKIVKTRMERQLRRLQQEHLLERERLRIARDLHDDLGAGLTHISLVSSTAESETISIEEARAHFHKIAGMTKKLVSSLYETVWTVDPANDCLESMVNYLGQLTENLCEPAALRCRIKMTEFPKERPVTSEIRHNISLALKEAVHNAVKYSQGTEVAVQFTWSDPVFSVTITDNGIGFDIATSRQGNGLKNMRRRMAAVGGNAVIESRPGAGTAVKFQVALPPWLTVDNRKI